MFHDQILQQEQEYSDDGERCAAHHVFYPLSIGLCCIAVKDLLRFMPDVLLLLLHGGKRQLLAMRAHACMRTCSEGRRQHRRLEGLHTKS